MDNNINFDFSRSLKEERTYGLLFPEREVGLAIVLIFEKIEQGAFEDQKFTEKDLHEAFEKIYVTRERYPKEVYSGHIMNLQEYFLDYDQQSQKYYFKDYAYKFCRHAKDTLKGAFNPTRIQKICRMLSDSLRDTDDLRFWLEDQFPQYEPDLREQIDFLDRQISISIDNLKKETNLSKRSFLDALVATEERLNISQGHVVELRAAYSETKMIRSLLEKRQDLDVELSGLIADVHAFIRYINDRLASIDRKLDRIQPKVRQLFSALNKPAFNSKVEKFILLMLDHSCLENKQVIFPLGIVPPTLHIPTPSFTVIYRDKELFPARPKPLEVYVQNEEVIAENKRKIMAKLEEADLISKWERFLLSEVQLKETLNLSEAFFRMIREEGSSQIAASVLFNLVKHVYNHPQEFELHTEQTPVTDHEIKNITLWKMSITKK